MLDLSDQLVVAHLIRGHLICVVQVGLFKFFSSVVVLIMPLSNSITRLHYTTITIYSFPLLK